MPAKEIGYTKGEAPVHIEIQKVRSLATHWQDGLEVVWVLSGRIDLYETHLMYHLSEGDVFVVNYNEPHKLLAPEGEEATVAFIYLDVDYFTTAVPYLREVNFAHYYFSKTRDVNTALENIYRFIASIYFLQSQPVRDERYQSKLDSLAVFFVKVLVDTFRYSYYEKKDGQYYNMLDRSPNLTHDQILRLQRLTYYIWTNSQNSLSLDDLANTEFYSRFYISHFIKKAYGLSFQETVALTRVVSSERLLIDTDYSLDRIADLVGFSNRSQYCSQFKRWHGMPPSQYRKENKPGAQGNADIVFPVDAKEAENLLSAYKK
jgi:xylan 1,4-beta-xylosidase